MTFMQATPWKMVHVVERFVKCKNPSCNYMATESWRQGLVFGICTKCGTRWDRKESDPING